MHSARVIEYTIRPTLIFHAKMEFIVPLLIFLHFTCVAGTTTYWEDAANDPGEATPLNECVGMDISPDFISRLHFKNDIA